MRFQQHGDWRFDDPLADDDDAWPGYVAGRTTGYLIGRAATIYGGAREVQKNIIARLAFGL
jgi:hypothetical protein